MLASLSATTTGRRSATSTIANPLNFAQALRHERVTLMHQPLFARLESNRLPRPRLYRQCIGGTRA
jgi:hypothetical protein